MDTPNYTMFELKESRAQVEDALGEKMTQENLMGRMTRTEKCWKLVANFTEEVLGTKKNKEGERLWVFQK